MVKNYRYDKINEKFAVIERTTDQTIKIVDTKEDAKAWTNKFNGGQGFNGWTPAFFLLKAEIKFK